MKIHGHITTDSGAGVWPHEMQTAKALANAGYDVHFIRKSEIERATSADVAINNEQWEMKSPTSDKLHALRKNIEKALHQSDCVIIDFRRFKKIPNKVLMREAESLCSKYRSLKHLIVVNKYGEVIELK